MLNCFFTSWPKLKVVNQEIVVLRSLPKDESDLWMRDILTQCEDFNTAAFISGKSHRVL